MKKITLISIMLLISFFVFAQSNYENKANTKKERCDNKYDIYLSTSGDENDIYLFHLYPHLYEGEFFDRVIYNEFLKRQKYITPDMQGVRVSYVLYRLHFFNCMINVFSSGEFGFDWVDWDGVMFYDYEKKRLLVIRLTKSYPLEKKDFYLKKIDDELCSTIEYFDLNKGIYEFAASDFLPYFNSGIDIKKDRIEIVVTIMKGTFPGIDRDYCCKESIPITDEIRAFLNYEKTLSYEHSGNAIYPVSEFRKDLKKIDRETYKRFEQFWKSPEGKKYKLLITSTQSLNIPYLYKLEQEQEKTEQQKKRKPK